MKFLFLMLILLLPSGPAAGASTMAATSTTSLPPIPHNIASIAGPQLIGIMLNWFLYGVLVMQIYIYYQSFPGDRMKVKALVYGVFALDTIQSILPTVDAFHWFAIGYGNTDMLSDTLLTPFDAPTLDGIIAFVVQSFFCWRIWVLQKSWWLPSCVFILAVASFAGAIASGIGAFQIHNLRRISALRWQLSLWLAGSALTDTLIAVSMTYLLLRSRRLYYDETNNILVRIVRLTFVTNTATASVAIALLVCFIAIPHNTSIVAAPAYALGKLYSNTLVAIFNNRLYYRNGMSRNRSATTTTFEIDFRDPSDSEATTELKSISQRQRTRSQSEPPPPPKDLRPKTESEDHIHQTRAKILRQRL